MSVQARHTVYYACSADDSMSKQLRLLVLRDHVGGLLIVQILDACLSLH